MYLYWIIDTLSLKQGIENPGIEESDDREIRELANPRIDESGNRGCIIYKFFINSRINM